MVSIDSLVLSAAGSVLAVIPSLLVLRRVRRLEVLNVHDWQTGLRSGRLYDDDAALLCRSLCAMAVLLIDLDDFRRFNERGYREEGDRALQTVAQVLKESLQRAADRIYRMHSAGDEFIIVLTVEDFREAYRQAERLRRAIELASVPGSIGIAYAEPSTQRNPAQLLRLATTNKNAAKQRGGNCVYPLPEEPQPISVEPQGEPKPTEQTGMVVVPIDWETTERVVIGHGPSVTA